MQWGVNIAIFDQDGRILLTKREDFEVWCLPGGGMDEGETPFQSAIREAKEETGLDVHPTRLVGIYSYPSWMGEMLHIICVSADIVGGTLTAQPSEVVDMRFFDLDSLPDPLETLVGQGERAKDAHQGVVGKLQTEYRAWQFPTGITRKELYAMRDASGLGRKGFYQANFQPLTPEQIEVNIAGEIIPR